MERSINNRIYLHWCVWIGGSMTRKIVRPFKYWSQCLSTNLEGTWKCHQSFLVMNLLSTQWCCLINQTCCWSKLPLPVAIWLELQTSSTSSAWPICPICPIWLSTQVEIFLCFKHWHLHALDVFSSFRLIWGLITSFLNLTRRFWNLSHIGSRYKAVIYKNDSKLHLPSDLLLNDLASYFLSLTEVKEETL